MKKIKPIILAHPTSDNDPLFFRNADGYLFPLFVTLMQKAGVLTEPILSVSRGVADRFLKTIESWDIPCVLSNHSLPQHRLEELARSDDSDGYLLLTPYSYLLEKERVDEAVQFFNGNAVQCVNFKGVSSSNSFCLVDDFAVKILSRYDEFAITPFVAATYLRDSTDEAVVVDLPAAEDAVGMAFLNTLLYQGDNGVLPQSFITGYLDHADAGSRFSSQSYREYLASYYSIESFDEFLGALADLLEKPEFLAGQIHLIKRVLPHLPERKECFLELGFGRHPVASQLLLNVFDHGHAVEPFIAKPSDCRFIEYVSRNMAIPEYIDLERTKDGPKVMENLSVHTSHIHECGIPEESVDFIFSKTVFEHVQDVPGVSKTLFDILRPGGTMYHIVDFRDHVDTFSIRFDFLKYDKETWAEVNGETNLWRVNDVVSLWEEIGFEVEIVERSSRVLEVKDLHPCWNTYDPDDLFCYSAIIVARKPPFKD